MRATFLLLVPVALMVAASAPARGGGEPVDPQLRQAQQEQAAAEAQAARLGAIAKSAKTEADRLRAQQAAAAQAIEAAEARITIAEVQARLATAAADRARTVLAQEQQPVASLLAGLAVMGRRPPLLALADHRGTDELVRVRILLDSTLPAIRSRTAAISAQLAQAEQLRRGAIAAKGALGRSRAQLAARESEFAALEQRASAQAAAAGGQALSASDVAIASGEDVERLQGSRSARASALNVARLLAAEPPAFARPTASEGPPANAPFDYQLPAAAVVTDGMGAISAGGVRSRGLTLQTPRGTTVAAPASGTLRYSGPFRDYDGVVIIDHGGGWLTLLVNVASELAPGSRIAIGQPVGRALGPLQVELSHNGRRISPAIIAGSSQTLSNEGKGG